MPPDLALLQENGWRLVDPAVVACGPIEFRDYVLSSAAEFSVAQGVYVDTRSGWFERPHGPLPGRRKAGPGAGYRRWRRNSPTGEGLLVFSTLDEAVAGVRSIRDNYDRHSAAARRLAETHFDSNLVLGRLMDDLGIHP